MAMTKAIVRPPAETFAAGLTSGRLGPPLLGVALAQHAAYCAALESCGLAVTQLPPDPRFPDSTFVEDVAVVTSRGALIARPGAPSRLGEVDSMREALVRAFGSTAALESIEPPGTLDGGDVCDAGDHVFIGVSERTNAEGARQAAAWFERQDRLATLVDIRGLRGLLHLKSGLAWLGRATLAATAALARHEPFRAVAEDRYDLLAVPAGEEYAANCVRVNERVLVAGGHPRFETALSAAGFSPIALEMSEFAKMDGGLSCLSLRW